ncbi:MAG: MarR family transcriptional regulator, partial [Stigonema ocellatum SAG 48.90 = DSM 106950]|nr:MarR family transcriptional regulator [Stigonema ocellatum SAG 48.90 = DSM 106950]
IDRQSEITAFAATFSASGCNISPTSDDIAEKLEFSRGNVSMGLKELQAWRLVRLRHFPGDRRRNTHHTGAD